VGSDEAKMAVMVMATETREVMTIEQVAEYLQAGADDVRRLIEEYGMPALEVREGQWRIPRGVLDQWLNRRARLRSQQRPAEGEGALRRANELRERILRDRGGVPLPDGFGVDAMREAREGD